MYPQPRAVHLDDEIYRIVARLGIADEFAAISRPALGSAAARSSAFRVLAEFHRDTARSVHGFPQANMFDQPEFEALLRANLKRYPSAELRGDAEVTEIDRDRRRHVRVTFTDRSDGHVHQVDADYVLGCDGANSVVRARIGSAMRDLKFEQRWLVVDVATDADLHQWEGVHQVCDPVRAGTYMRIGPTRYRWEFRLLRRRNRRRLRHPGRAAAADRAVDRRRRRRANWNCCASPSTRSARRSPTGGAGETSSSSAMRRTSLPRSSARAWAPGVRDAMNLAWKIAGVLDGTLAARRSGQLRAGTQTACPAHDSAWRSASAGR